jgi:RNA polymerase sigma factor (sigma-70 family)
MANQDDRLATGNPLWEDVDRRFRAPLMAYFFRRVGDRRDAEDLTQEVFIRLTRHPDKPSEERAEAYVFMIAANLLKDRGRHRISRQAAAHRSLSDIVLNVTTPQNLVEDRDPERVFAARETLQDVIAALGEMSERTREVFILARLENMHQRDIAALYGISVSAVEKHIMRALGVLTARFLS